MLVPSELAEDDEAPRRPRVTRQTPIGKAIDTQPQHPGYGLTPQRVNRIFRDSENGTLFELADLYDDLIESDGHLRSLFESRISAVAGKGRTIQPGGPDAVSLKASQLLEDALEERNVDLGAFMEHQLEAPFKGYSASEIIWGLDDGLWIPLEFDNIAHRRFCFSPETNTLRLVERGNIKGAELWEDKWVVATARHSNLARAGLFRTATWWALFKRLSIRDWIVFAEIFGIPHRIGYYNENASPEAKSALEQALKDIGEGGQAIISELTRIEISNVAQRDGEGAGVHEQIVLRCDAEISKLLTGATLTVESGGPGSFALGKVHENRAYALELADANRLRKIWRRFVAVPFMKFNGFTAAGGKPPQLNIQVFPSLDPETRVKVMSVLVNELGLEVDGWHVAEQLGFRRPMKPEDATKPMKVKSNEQAPPQE